MLSRDRKEFVKTTKHYLIVTANTHGRIPDQFGISYEWPQASGNPFISAAYEGAIQSMQDSLTISPTSRIQHVRLEAMRNGCVALDLDYTSYLVCKG